MIARQALAARASAAQTANATEGTALQQAVTALLVLHAPASLARTVCVREAQRQAIAALRVPIVRA